MSPRTSIGCVQNDFRAYGTFDANHALSCVKISTISKHTEHSLEPRQLGVPSGASKMIYEPMVRSTHTVHLSHIKISTIPIWTELSREPLHLGVPSGVSKTISEPTVHLVQTVHLSYTDTNTISKWKEVRFHIAYIT
jgi:hypothetical protein